MLNTMKISSHKIKLGELSTKKLAESIFIWFYPSKFRNFLLGWVLNFAESLKFGSEQVGSPSHIVGNVVLVWWLNCMKYWLGRHSYGSKWCFPDIRTCSWLRTFVPLGMHPETFFNDSIRVLSECLFPQK